MPSPSHTKSSATHAARNATEYGSIVEISVPVPASYACFCMNTRMITRYAFSGVIVFVTLSPMR